MAKPATDTFLTFAYGSNMLTSRLRDRCPSAEAQGVATLHGYELHWHKHSIDGSGKCDVVRVDDAAAVVYGVLFSIARSEKSDLDRAEGLGRGYDEKQVDVSCCKGATHRAQLYVATKQDRLLKPYTWYKAMVVAGAREHGLPPDYMAQLEAVPAVEDADAERHTKNMELVESR